MGDRARFQLFGDTVNTGTAERNEHYSLNKICGSFQNFLTHCKHPCSIFLFCFIAARMESTGAKDKIHISQATADLLIQSGKSNWIKPREDIVEAKGKGVLKTYWLNTH